MWTWNRWMHLTNIYKTKTRWLIHTHTKSKKPKWRYAIHILQNGNILVSFITHYSRMLFGIIVPERCLFLVLPNGLCCEPRTFTKMAKPLIATLRLDGHIIAIYIDDLVNVGLTFDECIENVITSTKLLNSLGFIIHPDKSIFLPKQVGFNINSKKWK